MKRLLSLFLLFHFSDLQAEEVKVIADLQFVEDTKIESQSLCIENGECSTWATFIMYEVQVKSVILGSNVSKSFKAIYSQHETHKASYNDAEVILKKLEPGNQFSAQYQVVNIE